MKLTPEMKEIALRVAEDCVCPCGMQSKESLLEFAERFLAALPKPEPVAALPHSWTFLQQGLWHWTEDKRDWYDGVNVEEVLPLYTAPPQDTAVIEQTMQGHYRLVRELDVLLNGEEGAAKQASLCDIVAQVRRDGVGVKATIEQRVAEAIVKFMLNQKYMVLQPTQTYSAQDLCDRKKSTVRFLASLIESGKWREFL